MNKRHWAIAIKKSISGIIVAYTVSTVLAWFMRSPYSDENVFLSGLYGLAFYIVASFLIAIINGLAGLLYLWADKGNDLRSVILSELHALRLPAPGPGDMKNATYLQDLANDAHEDSEHRVKAATVSATLAIIIKHAGLFGGLAWQRAADEAVLKYSQEAPQR